MTVPIKTEGREQPLKEINGPDCWNIEDNGVSRLRLEMSPCRPLPSRLSSHRRLQGGANHYLDAHFSHQLLYPPSQAYTLRIIFI